MEEIPRPRPRAAKRSTCFARSRDDAALAWATTGSGPPLLRGGHWLTRLEQDWRSPIWRPFLQALGRDFSVTRRDQRGTGLSAREFGEFTVDRLADDMKAVADAAGLERFPVFAVSQGVPAAIRFAVKHSERLTRLVIYGGFAAGPNAQDDPAARAEAEAMRTLVRSGRGRPDSAFVQAFSTMFMPEGTPEQLPSFVEMQFASVSPENAARIRGAIQGFDGREDLASVRTPTPVIHAERDSVQPLDGARRLAAGIPGAELLVLKSRNHVPLPQDTAWTALLGAVRDFILAGPPGS